jgi:hypothetical protein
MTKKLSGINIDLGLHFQIKCYKLKANKKQINNKHHQQFRKSYKSGPGNLGLVYVWHTCTIFGIFKHTTTRHTTRYSHKKEHKQQWNNTLIFILCCHGFKDLWRFLTIRRISLPTRHRYVVIMMSALSNFVHYHIYHTIVL